MSLLIIAFIIFCLLCYGNDIKAEIINCIKTWYSVIIPSVFPYLVISKYIAELPFEKLGYIFPGKYLIRVLRLSEHSLGAIAASFVCGYPSGAIIAQKSFKDGQICADEAKRLICFTNNAGPLFLISAVGGSILNSIADGAMIYLIQLISAFLWAMLFASGSYAKITNKTHTDLKRGDFCTYVSQSVNTILNICGYMLCACIAAKCTIILANNTFGGSEFLDIVSSGFFEITQGIKKASAIANAKLRFAVICAFVSWSGLSVIMQIISTSDKIVGLWDISLAKLCQAAISFILGYSYKSINKSSAFVKAHIPYAEISLILSAAIFALYILIKNIRECRR